MSALSIRTNLGMITLFEHEDALVALDWGEGMESDDHTPLLDRATAQVSDYLLGKRQDFDLPTRANGTKFQTRIWAAMAAIPYGQTRTYGEIAAQLNTSPRAVGTACGRNPVPLIIPCHRIVGVSSLGGYSAGDGLDTKTALLRLEGAKL